MIVHILLLIYISICGLLIFLRGVTPSKNKRFVILAFLGVLLVQSLRSHQVGLDTYDYYIAFTWLRGQSVGGTVASWEPLYLLLNRIIGFFTANPQWLFFIGSIIIDAGVMIFIIYNTEEGKSTFWPVVFWIVFLNYFNSMNLFRQYLAMAFVSNIFTLLVREQSRKTYFWSVVLLVIGMCFHISSIIMIAVFVPFMLKWDRKIALVIASLLAFGVFLFSDWLIQAFLFLFPKYTRYLTTTNFRGASVGGFYIGISAIRIICVSIVFLLPVISNESKKYLYPLSVYMIVSLALYALKTRSSLFNRVNYYFDIFQVVYYSRIIDKFRMNAIIKVFVYFVCWAIFLYTMSSYGGSRGCVPYTFFWQVYKIGAV